MATGFREGRHLVICDISGQQVWDDEVKRQWDGAIVRTKSWSPRHPQELIRAKPERGAVFPSRPGTVDRFTTTRGDTILTEQSPEGEFWNIVAENNSYIWQE